LVFAGELLAVAGELLAFVGELLVFVADAPLFCCTHVEMFVRLRELVVNKVSRHLTMDVAALFSVLSRLEMGI
jgi:hypothetical protein